MRGRVSRPASFIRPRRQASGLPVRTSFTPKFTRAIQIQTPFKSKGRARCAAFSFRYFDENFAAKAVEIRLAGGAKIVGRRLARAAIRHDFVGDLLAFTQRAKA